MQREENVSVYEGEVPLHLEPEMDRLYGSLYSSLSYFRNTADLNTLNTYVARNQGGITAILLFTIHNGMLRVVNEGMQLRASDVSDFARFAFDRYSDVSAITLHAVQVSGEDIPFYHQGFFCTEDFIAELPATPDAYLASLGGSTKRTLKWSRNRVERTFPSFTFQVHEHENVREEDVRTLIEMKQARMKEKKKISHIDEAKEQTILRLTRACGALCTASIDGKICAGTTAFRIGDSVYSWLNAHDPLYNNYRVGMLCNFLTICAFIERGARRFHFGHTRYDYKSALLGRFQPYEHLVLYRSHLHFLKNVPHALNVAVDGYALMLRRKLLEGTQSHEGLYWNVARKGLEIWRGLKNRQMPGNPPVGQH